MEVKVSVDGVQRVVCGVTEETTCQEVVIAFAQALGQPGRYTLREKYKEFERSITPSERLIQSLQKFGQQTRDVQLTLLHNGPALFDGAEKTMGSRYQTCPTRRRKDAGFRVRRESATASLHRRSLPPLSSSEPPTGELKKQKRKSLTFMEEAREWLDSLGKSKIYNVSDDREDRRKNDRKNCNSIDVSVRKATSAPGSLMSKVRGQKSVKSDLDHQTTCCTANPRCKDSTRSKKNQTSEGRDLSKSRRATTEDEVEKNILRETIMLQLTCLQDLQVHITCIDKQIVELEEQHRAREAEQEAEQKMIDEEVEQIQLWENELKAEEHYETNLQHQFLAMRDRVVDCKGILEEYKHKMQRFDFSRFKNVTDLETVQRGDMNAENSIGSNQELDHSTNLSVDVTVKRNFLPGELPKAEAARTQNSGRRALGPIEPSEIRRLKESRTCWFETKSSKANTMGKVVHRSELTIYLRGTDI